MLSSVPKIAKNLTWDVENEKVKIQMENKGVFNFIMQKLIHKPKITTIHLDEIGSFVWNKIDGERTVEEIALQLKEKFGDKVNPLNERIERYFNILSEYNFILLRNKNGI